MYRDYLERPLQEDICAQLVAQGWAHSPNSADYDARRALYPADVLAWLQTSDPKNYASLIKPDADPATRQAQEKRLLDRLVAKLSAPEEQGGGTLNVPRKGFSVPGARRPFQLNAYPPQDKRNPELTALYQKNILRVVEEVRYNPADESARIDLVLFINGLPVATIELKSEYAQTIQDAINQLVTTTGTFQPITRGKGDSKAKQLVQALTSGVPIIGVTLQTFPFALEEMTRDGGQLAGKRFAIIADEAHSSQSGKATDSIKAMLNTQVEAGIEGLDPEADQEALTRMAQRVVGSGQQVSFFAFTATPKAKTLEIFGRRSKETGDYQPFDLYPMKQAIEEGFILDVLKNYTTYQMAAKIAQKNQNSGTDQEIDIRKGTKNLINFVELHPTNIASKVAVILEHFEGRVKQELGGKAKAMVVTSSRAATVRYQRAFEKAIAERGLPLKTLVAFSGELADPDREALPGADRPSVSEASMNPQLKGRNLAEVFNQDGQHILIVANKYQTGFDQPLLVAMYVDKKLSGITAVQTLSRLNRRAEGKENTYILDFVNDPEQIREAFAKYYEEAHIETESDLDLVAKQVDKLDAAGIYNRADVEQFWEKWVAPGVRQSSFDALISIPVQRFVTRWTAAREDQDKAALEALLEFRGTLAQYVRSYAFFSQIFNFGDPYYEKLSAFADLLTRKLRRFTLDEAAPEVVNVDDIVLTHYRLEKMREEEDLKLSAAQAEGLQGMTEAGLSRLQERERKARSLLIEKVNKYFQGLELSDEHQVGFATTFVVEAAKDSGLQQSAKANTKTDFYQSKKVRDGLANKLWDYSSDTADLIDYVRKMPPEQFMTFMLEMGLYELLRGESLEALQ